MKKIIALLLLLTVSLSLFGCKVKKYRCAWDGFCYAFNGTPIDEEKRLESGGSGYILDILNSGTWEVGTFDCDYDFVFTAMYVVYYHSLCGTFYDVTNGIILKVTEEQRLKINSFLKDSESPRYVWEGFYYVYGFFPPVFPIELKSNGAEYITDLLNNCVWENGIPDCNCDSDHQFLTPRQQIYYFSDCGTFYDMENEKVFKATEEQRLKVNSFFDNGMEYILDLCLDSVWKNEQPDSHTGCDSVYYLLEPKLHISYHPECGTFYNMETGSTFKATEEQRLKINSFLENGEYEKYLRRNL